MAPNDINPASECVGGTISRRDLLKSAAALAVAPFMAVRLHDRSDRPLSDLV